MRLRRYDDPDVCGRCGQTITDLEAGRVGRCRQCVREQRGSER